MTRSAVSINRPMGDQAAGLRSLVAAIGVGGVRARAVAAEMPRARRVPLVAITSGKGGVGKTSIAVNLAACLARAGVRTTLLDADLGMANADVICGLSPGRRLEHALGSAGLSGAPRLDQIAVEGPGGFRLVPGTVGLARMADLGPREREELIERLGELERGSDVVLVDTGAGIGPTVLAMSSCADRVVVVVTPDPTSITDAYATIKCLTPMRASGGAGVSILVNQARDEGEARGVHERIAGTCARFLSHRPGMLGWVRADAALAGAVRRRRLVVLDRPRSGSARDLRGIAQELSGLLALSAVAGGGRAIARKSFVRRLLGARK